MNIYYNGEVIMLIKKLFNLMFPEKVKQLLRQKFKNCFACIDRHIMYRNYMKAYRKIIHPIFFDGNQYEYRNNLFLKKIRGEYIKFLYSKKMECDNELRDCFEYIDKYGMDIFCYEDMHQKFYCNDDIHYDNNVEMFYAIYKGKKLYLKRSITTVEDAVNLLNSLAIEQLPYSPHCYLSSTFKPREGGIVFDIGCAEGNLVLDIIDYIDKAYMFECDEEWIEALNMTFEQYKEKVCIIPKLVSDIDNDNNVTIDNFCDMHGISSIDFIKMDVEGFEKKVLLGCSKMLTQKAISKIVACVYHNYNDERELGELINRNNNYMFEVPQRYMAWNDKFDLSELTDELFTHGIIRATLKD